MTTSHYDLVIAGTQLPGLILGALCAKRGYRVLVAGGTPAQNRYEHGPYTYFRETEFLTGFESSPAIKEVMTGLSMALHMRGRPEKKELQYQVLSPQGRLDVTGQDKVTEREIRREYGDAGMEYGLVQHGVKEEAEALQQFFLEHPTLPPEGWAEKREFTKKMEEHPRVGESSKLLDPLRYLAEDSSLRGFWEVPLRFSSWMDLGKAAALPRMRVFGHLRAGTYEMKGGLDALREGFIGKVRQYSCDYRPEVLFHGLTLKRGKVTEAHVQDRRESIGCNFIVCNSDEKLFFNMVAPEDRKERYHHRIHSLATTHNVFTINIAIAEEGIPAGLGAHSFLISDPSQPLEDENAIHIMKTRKEGKKSEPGVVVLTASCHLKARHLTPTVSFVQERVHRVLSRIRERILPFLDEHVLDVHCPWLELDKRTSETRYSSQNVRSIMSSAPDDFLDASPLPLTTEYKNVLLCNRNSNSGLGLEGAFLSALNAYRLIEARMPLKSPLR